MLMELIYGIDVDSFMGNMFYVFIAFVLFDVLTGLLRAAKDRMLNSSINFDGLIRKFGELIGVVFLTFIDLYLNVGGVLAKTGVGLLILYETISIVENFKQIGVNFDFVMKYFDEDKYLGGKK